MSGTTDLLILLGIVGVGLYTLSMIGVISIGGALNETYGYAAFKPGFAKDVRTMCDNSGCYPIN